jgi:putative ABC transport system substrate-binding protein
MRRRCLLVALLGPAAGLAWLSTLPLVAAAERVARVGWIAMRDGATPGAFEAFRRGLRDRGWVEGRNLLIDARVGDRADAKRLYGELVRDGADVIAATGAIGLDVGLMASEVPVVFVVGGDPVEAGLVQSMARPHGNRTGMTMLAYELIGKRLELVKQIVPGLERVGYLYYAPHAGARQELKEASAAAAALGLSLRPLPLDGAADIEPALQAIVRERLQVLLTATDSLIGRNARRIADFAMARGVPVVSGWSAHVDDGFLLSYGAGVQSFFDQLAGYADRALRGVPVSAMPAETPSNVELTINRRTLKTLGLALPPQVQARVDRFIDGPQ